MAPVRPGLTDSKRWQGPRQRRGLHPRGGTGRVCGPGGAVAPAQARLISARPRPGRKEAAGRKRVAWVEGAYAGFCLSARRPTVPERRCPVLNITLAAQADMRPLAGIGAGAFTCEGAWVGPFGSQHAAAAALPRVQGAFGA